MSPVEAETVTNGDSHMSAGKKLQCLNLPGIMEKIPFIILSMCFKIVLIYLICYKISSKTSSASETAAPKSVGSTDEKYHLPHLELDDATAKSHNSTDEDDGSRIVETPFLSEMHVNATKTSFLCSNITLNEREFELSSENSYRQSYILSLLKICHLKHPSNTTMECKPIVEDEIVVEYAPACSFIITSFIYCTFYLLCSWDWIISVPKFVMLFLASNVLTYFLICCIFTGSLSGILVYFLPIHINFLFLLIMFWVTIQSCKDVFRVLKSHRLLVLHINFYRFYMFHGADAILCLLPILTGPGSRSYIVHTCGNSLESMYFQMLAQYGLDMMAQYTLSMIPLVTTSTFFGFTNFIDQKERVKYVTIGGIKYLFYCTVALSSWAYGFYLVTFPDYLKFWRFYSYVATAQPIFFLLDIIMTAKGRHSFLIELSKNSEEIYQIRDV